MNCERGAVVVWGGVRRMRSKRENLNKGRSFFAIGKGRKENVDREGYVARGHRSQIFRYLDCERDLKHPLTQNAREEVEQRELFRNEGR